MKTFLLSLTVVIASLAVNESAFIGNPFIKLVKELDELKSIANDVLEHQEQPSNLMCASCQGSSPDECTLSETAEVCTPPSDACMETMTSNLTTTMVERGCFVNALCGLACMSRNQSGNILSCDIRCCNSSLCNAGVPVTPSSIPTPSAEPTSGPLCGGPLVGTSGTFTSPGFPNEYPPDVTCNFTIVVPLGFTLVETITANLTGTGDSLTIFQGDTVVATIPPVNGKRKRSINYEQLFEDLFGEDTRNYYDEQHYKDYYYYDGRRKKEPYFYERRKKQVIPMMPVTVSISGNGQLISNVFMSNGSVQTNGFSAAFTVERDTDGITTDTDGSETDNGGNSSVSGGSSGGSSDEEEY